MVRVEDGNPDSFAERLKLAIGDRSVNSFAKEAGLNEGSIRGYLRGGLPAIDKAKAMADAAGVSLEWLASGVGPMRLFNGEPTGGPAEPGPGDAPIDQYGSRINLGGPISIEAETPHVAAADEDLMSKIGELVANVHREMGVSLPPSQLFRLAARKHNEVMAARPGEGELPVMIKLLETQLRAELKEARSEPGTGKRLA